MKKGKWKKEDEGRDEKENEGSREGESEGEREERDVREEYMGGREEALES